jgi:hypothetical protein
MKFFKSIVFILIQTACFGQTTASTFLSVSLPNINYIAIAPDNFTINLDGISLIQAGAQLTFTSNNTKWINFTSAISSNSLPTRRITAQITSGSIPSGMTLKLTISAVSGMYSGIIGTNSSSINLSNIQQVIISGIGGSYTGQGSSNGYNLRFELVISDYSQLRAGNTSLGITFTIT